MERNLLLQEISNLMSVYTNRQNTPILNDSTDQETISFPSEYNAFTQNLENENAINNFNKQIIDINSVLLGRKLQESYRTSLKQQHTKIVTYLIMTLIDIEYLQTSQDVISRLDELNVITNLIRTEPLGLGLNINYEKQKRGELVNAYSNIAKIILDSGKPPVLQSKPLSINSQGSNIFINPKKDIIGFNLTGRYESESLPNAFDLKECKGITLNINQVGYWVEGVLSFVMSPNTTKNQVPTTYFSKKYTFYKPYIRFYMSLESIEKKQNKVRLHFKEGSLFPFDFNSLNVILEIKIDSSPGKLKLVYMGQTEISFTKITTKAFLTERHLSDDVPGTVFQEWIPILNKQRINLNKFFITSDVNSYQPLVSTGKAVLRTTQLREEIEKLANTGSVKNLELIKKSIVQFIEENFNPADYNKAVYYIKLLLNIDGFQSSKNSFKLTYLGWIYRYLLIHKETIRYLFEDLPALTSDNYKYTIKIDLKGLGLSIGVINVGMFWGTMTVKCEAWKKLFNTDSKEFKVNYKSIGGGIGLKLKTGDTMSGVGYSPILWSPEDFRGNFSLNKANFGISVGVAGGDTYFGDMNITSYKNLPEMHIKLGDLSKLNFKIAGSKKFSLGASADVTLVGLGNIKEVKDNSVVSSQLVPHGNNQTEYKKSYKNTESVHFKHNGAELSKGALNLIRRLCATELALFVESSTEIKIIGHTDSVGDITQNKKLSAARASNVESFIQNNMGNKLEAKLDAIFKGESEENKKGIDNIRNPRARRVDIEINGVVVLTLW